VIVRSDAGVEKVLLDAMSDCATAIAGDIMPASRAQQANF
jgi:hypothetical protein